MKIRLEDDGNVKDTDWTFWFDISSNISFCIAGLNKKHLLKMKSLIEKELVK